MAMSQMDQTNPEAMAPQDLLAMMGPVMGVYAILIVLSVIVMSVLTAAVYRAAGSESGDRTGFLRFGADEFRQMAVGLIIGLLGFVALIVVTLVFGIIVGFSTAMSGGAGNVGVIIGVTALLYVAMAVGGLAFYTKFSFAGPMTFVSKRIRIFESWKATSGRFWPLAGCYLMATLLGLLVAFLGWVISIGGLMALGGTFEQAMVPDMSSLAAFLTPGRVAYLAVNAVFSALSYIIFLSPAFAAWLQIHGSAANVGRTFD
ncbi:MAG TPA: hypothetical protein VLZ73_12600, partial [Brevundimonas sp.]|nr:hypothetical protein [Brevundimonas sp.]